MVQGVSQSRTRYFLSLNYVTMPDLNDHLVQSSQMLDQIEFQDFLSHLFHGHKPATNLLGALSLRALANGVFLFF